MCKKGFHPLISCAIQIGNYFLSLSNRTESWVFCAVTSVLRLHLLLLRGRKKKERKKASFTSSSPVAAKVSTSSCVVIVEKSQAGEGLLPFFPLLVSLTQATD